MNILIVEETEKNRKAALVQLGQKHQITIVSSFQEAKEALYVRLDIDFYRRMKKELGTYPSDGHEAAIFWIKRAEEIHKEALIRPKFDAVLTGLMMRDYFSDKQNPLGLSIAFNALNAGVKRVALVCSMEDDNVGQTIDVWGGAHFDDRDSLNTMKFGDREVMFSWVSKRVKPNTFEEVQEIPRPYGEESEIDRVMRNDRSWRMLYDPSLITVKAWDLVLNRLFESDRLSRPE